MARGNHSSTGGVASTTVRGMSHSVDLDDLIDSTEVARILHLSSKKAVSVYRARYADFPTPVIAAPNCSHWLRGEVEAWLVTHPQRPGRRARTR